MGCIETRQKLKIEEGSTLCEDSAPISSLWIFVLLKDAKCEELSKKKIEFFHDYLLVIRFKEIVRSSSFCTVKGEHLLFEFRLYFDEKHLEIMNSPLEIEICCNEMFTGKILIEDLRSSIFYLSKLEATLSGLRDREMKIEFHYGWIGEYFENIKTLSNDFLTANEQKAILLKALKLENINYGILDSQMKDMLGYLLERKEKELTFEKLIEQKNPFCFSSNLNEDIKSKEEKNIQIFDILEELLKNFNPFFLGLNSNFKIFLQNIVPYDERFDDFVADTIKKNIGNYLIYQTNEAFKIMLKEMFKTKEDPNDYFSKHAKEKHGNSPLMEPFFKTSWLFDFLILPLFNQDVLSAINICNVLDLFENFEDYFLANKNKLEHLDYDSLFLENEHARIINLIKSPEFHDIELNVLHIYGHSEPKLSSFLGCQDPQVIVNRTSKCFSSNPGETKNLIVVAEQKEGKNMFISHVYMHSPGKHSTSPLIKAEFFTSDNIPEEKELMKFVDMKFEDFSNEEFHKNQNLIYCGYIDLGKQGNKIQSEYKEIHYENLIKGKYLVVWGIESFDDVSNIEIGKLGCLGYINEDDAKKYNPKIFKFGKSRVRPKNI